MPILSLLADHLCQLFSKVIFLRGKPLHFRFVLHFYRCELISEVFVLIRKFLVDCFNSCACILALLLVSFKFRPSSSRLLPELNISCSLPHHVINTCDGILNVVWLSPEQVADSWYPVRLLRLSDVAQVVHQ